MYRRWSDTKLCTNILNISDLDGVAIDLGGGNGAARLVDDNDGLAVSNRKTAGAGDGRGVGELDGPEVVKGDLGAPALGSLDNPVGIGQAEVAVGVVGIEGVGDLLVVGLVLESGSAAAYGGGDHLHVDGVAGGDVKVANVDSFGG